MLGKIRPVHHTWTPLGAGVNATKIHEEHSLVHSDSIQGFRTQLVQITSAVWMKMCLRPR